MPYPTEHAARIENPDRYAKFRRRNKAGGEGVDFVYGVLPDGTVELQAVRFDAELFTPEEARKWLEDHGHTARIFEPARKGKAQEFHRLVTWRAAIRELAAPEIERHVGADRMAAIRASDEHPMFLSLLVAEEGESRGELVVEGRTVGNRRKVWPAEAIRELGIRLNDGRVHLYTSHPKPGETWGRSDVGHAVSGYVEPGPPLARAYGIGYISDAATRSAVTAGKLDTCSVEADCVFLQDPSGNLTVQRVEGVTGIALGDSKQQAPGFPGAAVVAVVQELQQPKPEGRPMEASEVIEGMKVLTHDQLRAALAGAGVSPSQLFTADQLRSDAGVQGVLGQTQRDLDAARQQLATVTTERDTLKGEATKGRLGSLKAASIGKYASLSPEEKDIVQVLLDARDWTAEADPEKAIQEAVQAQVQKLNALRAKAGAEAISTDAPPAKSTGGSNSAGTKTPVSPDTDPFLAANHATAEGELVPVAA